MAIMKVEELRKLSPSELDKKLNEMYLELAKNKAQIIIGSAPESPGKIREIKRTIARILTIKNEMKKSKVNEKETKKR
ncbi:MAG: 50S ribosomal protein L29 [Candidatus Aenigmarchaeota archaeon]|nr:50S ribosomal protein L29 [Candidatus Aenigmarchaeota archaeon]